MTIDPGTPIIDAPPPGGLVEPGEGIPIESGLLRVAIVLRTDQTMTDRIGVALTMGGYATPDVTTLVTTILASRIAQDALTELREDPAVAEILARHPDLNDAQRLVDAITVTSIGMMGVEQYHVDSSAIPDELIEAGVRVAYQRRAEFGLDITRAEDRVAPRTSPLTVATEG